MDAVMSVTTVDQCSAIAINGSTMPVLSNHHERPRNSHALESEEAREQQLARDRARRRQHLASKTAKERETYLS